MRILVVCDHGVSRSVTLADQLRWLGNDCLTCGLESNSTATFWMLEKWAELIIFTSQDQMDVLSAEPDNRKQLWQMPPDTQQTRRPYNPIMLDAAQRLVKEHKDEVDNRPPKATKNTK